MGHHTGAAGRLAAQRHPRRIPAKSGNVLVDPGEGQLLVAQPQVGRGRRVLCGEKAEGAEAVVEAHHHQVLIEEPLGAVGAGGGGAVAEGPAMQPDQDWIAGGALIS